MTILVFDIETIPDIESGRKLFALDGLSDEDTACAMFALRREKAGNDFLPHYLQKICAISVVISHGNQIKVWSLGDENSDEKELITRFLLELTNIHPPWSAGMVAVLIFLYCITDHYTIVLARPLIGRQGKINKPSNGTII